MGIPDAFRFELHLHARMARGFRQQLARRRIMTYPFRVQLSRGSCEACRVLGRQQHAPTSIDSGDMKHASTTS